MTDTVRLELKDPSAILDGDGQNPDGVTRVELLRRAALGGGGALIGGGLFLSGVPKAYAQSGPTTNDVQTLNVLLLNESLEAAFYAEAVNRGGLSGAALRFARQLALNEAAHRDAVRAALGAAAQPVPGFNFGNTTLDQSQFLTTALALESGDVAVINGAGPAVSKALLAVAGQIVSVEARQAAWVRRIIYAPRYPRGQAPAPRAFDGTITLAQAQAALAATGFIQS